MGAGVTPALNTIQPTPQTVQATHTPLLPPAGGAAEFAALMNPPPSQTALPIAFLEASLLSCEAANLTPRAAKHDGAPGAPHHFACEATAIPNAPFPGSFDGAPTSPPISGLGRPIPSEGACAPVMSPRQTPHITIADARIEAPPITSTTAVPGAVARHNRASPQPAPMVRKAPPPQSNAIAVSVHATEFGLRIFARVGRMAPTERAHLRHAVEALLAEHGFRCADFEMSGGASGGEP